VEQVGCLFEEGGPPLSRSVLNAKLFAIMVRSAREGGRSLRQGDRESIVNWRDDESNLQNHEDVFVRAEVWGVVMGAIHRILRTFSVVARAGEQVEGFGGWMGRGVVEVGEKGRR
jgi:hypothetical protein